MKWQKLHFISNYSNFLLFTGVWPLLYWWIALFQGLFSHQQSQVVYKMIGTKCRSPLTCFSPHILKNMSQVWRNGLRIYGAWTFLSVFFTGSSKASNDSLFNVESWKIRSLQHLAPLSPTSLEIWCEICTHYLFNQPSNCSFSRWYCQEVRERSLRGMRGPAPLPGSRQSSSPTDLLESFSLSSSLLPRPMIRPVSVLSWTPS